VSAATGPFTVGIDIGGTFTDCIVLAADGTITPAKVPTTPDDRSRGFFDSLGTAAERLGLELGELLGATRLIVHGTTTGTNAIVQRAGVDVGLLCTAGHSDVMFIMKGGGRTAGLPPDELLDVPATNKPVPLVPKKRIAEVGGRIDVDGDVVAPMDDAQVREAIAAVLAQDVGAIAISLLWAIKNPSFEHRVRELVAAADGEIFVSCASDLVSQVGEYERTATAVMNAHIGPLMVRYIKAIEDGLAERGFAGQALFAQCVGGAMTGEEARLAPIRTVDSGPVAGVASSRHLAERLGEPNVIVTDMGGTTFDVAVIHRGVPLHRETSILQRYELALPMVDIESVGAGGGSIAWIDESGRLNVGPNSAGADPGPACYGRGGTDPTVTDADIVLGVIRPQAYLHGRMQLDPSLAEQAIGKVAEQLGMSVPATAAGINRIVDSRMADLIRRMSVMRGLDPREFACFAYGGGGPVHAAAVAREIGLARLIVPIPRAGALWSALGAATSELTHVEQEAAALEMPADPAAVTSAFERLETKVLERLEAQGFGDHDISLTRSVRMKFSMQVHDVAVALDPDQSFDEAGIAALDERFVATYEALFGKGAGYRGGGALITSFHVRAVAAMPGVEFAEGTPPGEVERGSRSVYWSEHGEFVDTPILTLSGGSVQGEDFEGPHLIEFPDTVVVIRPGMTARFDEHSNIVIDVAPSS
jgi:N-methylhydantoinase A